MAHGLPIPEPDPLPAHGCSKLSGKKDYHMLNGLLISQIIGPQTGPAIASQAGESSGSDGVFREVFGGMLGLSAAYAGLNGVAAGPGSAVSAGLASTAAPAGIKLSAAGQSEAVSGVIQQSVVPVDACVTEATLANVFVLSPTTFGISILYA